MIVADTNLVAYLLLAGERTEAAEAALLRDARWAAPPLWRSELRSVLVQHLRAGLLVPAEAAAVWARAEVLLAPATREPETGLVLQAALSRGLSTYDAEFVALAERLGVPLVTDDRRLLKACPYVAVSIDGFAGGSGAAEGDADRAGR